MKQPFPWLVILIVALGQACSPSRTIGKFAEKELLHQPGVRPAQVGISLYDPSTAKFLYNYQGDKYFIPASNTKLFSLFAGLKYLGDSLPGILYRETDTALFLIPCGDPTLLHPDYTSQPVVDLLKRTHKHIYLTDYNWQDKPLGRGWAWDDYNDYYMPERSPLPVYGNVIRWIEEGKQQEKAQSGGDNSFVASPSFYSIPEVDWEVRFTADTGQRSFFVQREWQKNAFIITEGQEKYKQQDVPFITDGINAALTLLKDTIGSRMAVLPAGAIREQLEPARLGSPSSVVPAGFHMLHSRPVDSLFRPMMHRSDNFFAEQTLLMVSRQLLGSMNDSRIIDTLLKSELKDLPQKPFWVDGSGLSRNDLFTPQDFVWLLNKMKNEFGLQRMKSILPTGGTGTLANYYKQDSGFIYAKTGSLSGVVALSGYLTTKTGRLLIFSILVNNHNDAVVRRKIEGLILKIRQKY